MNVTILKQNMSVGATRGVKDFGVTRWRILGLININMLALTLPDIAVPIYGHTKLLARL